MNRLPPAIHFLVMVVLSIASLSVPCFAAEEPGKAGILKFQQYSPAAATDEMIRRIMTPVSADRVNDYYRKNAQNLPQQIIVLEDELFDFYLPSAEPAKGYGLVVFIAPMDEAEIPYKWRKVFDRQGIVYVAARKSGNDHNMIGRRIPLALHAYENISRMYRLDAERVYVSGFSGGSRTAMRVALYYPDIFRGAILNSGSDPFGTAGIAVPPAEIFRLFQTRTRIVQVTGTEDEFVKLQDTKMRTAATSFCVQHLYAQPMRKVGHAQMDGLLMEKAIARIEMQSADSAESADCMNRLQAEIENGLKQVQVFLDQGNKENAGKQLSEVDSRYGGLAAPRSVELARKIVSMGNIK